MKRDDLVWSDRKRNWLGLPWTFTVYGLTEDRLFIKTGVLNIHEDEVRLYRILDLSLRKTLWQRMVGLGTIHVDSSDKTMKAFDISNIRNCEDVKEQLSLSLIHIFTEDETKKAHQEIAGNIVKAARKTGRDFLIMSRGDSTLRGHYPLETQVLRDVLSREGPVSYTHLDVYKRQDKNK